MAAFNDFFNDYLIFSGISSFMKAPEAQIEDLQDGMVAVAGVSYDISCTSRIGARYAPQAIREAYRRRGSATVVINTGERMGGHDGTRVVDLGDLNVYPVDWDKTQQSLRESMRQIAETGALPIILGGDHFITHPLVQGFGEAVQRRNGGKIGYIQFSSQLDLGDQDPVWGKVWRGATTRRIMQNGTVDPKNMVWVGTNGYARTEQWEMAQELGLNVFTLNDVLQQGIVSVAERAAEIAGDGCVSVYLSVDFDVLDGPYAAGTGSPAFQGLENVHLLKAMDVLRRTKVAAMDIVGVNPMIDPNGIVGQTLATWLVTRFIAEKVLAWA